jgi:5-methylcytosine-specific restriction protein B
LVDKLKSYKGSSEQVALQNYVIVIDEINRGNVSQIFGELITLIEDNKRLGAYERLEVELTYSRDRFGVPPNLYIIGTMNTADRSVEALDTALRRRFNFIEKQPDYLLPELQKVVAGYTLADILRTLNRRIEKLMDKDHLLGHSYLMPVGSSLSDLKQVFKNKFIPLLQEYFFGDYSRLGLVLGEGFFEPSDNDGQIFAKFREVDNSDFENREIYRLRNMDSMSDREFEEALNGMMQS